MLFEPVWISSVEHMATFEKIYQDTSWLGRIRGVYKMPPDFPYIRMNKKLLGSCPVVPTVTFSQGQMQVDDRSFSFQAMEGPLPPKGGFTRHNLRTDWNFSIKSSEIISIEPFVVESPIMRYYSMPFTRVCTRHEELVLQDFLVCVGGLGPSMSHIKEQSQLLATALQTLKHGSLFG